jgi:hypothetical protein
VRAAIGFRPHSGWAALVAVADTPESVTVVERRKIQLAGPGIPKQPYHAVENLSVEKADARIREWVQGSRRLASQAFGETLDELRRKGHQVAGCALLLASGRPLPGLAAILASHALIHTADGEHFREAIVHAAGKRRLTVAGIREKEIWERASAQLLLSIEELRRHIDGLGKTLGPPWTQDQKLAALAAWMALKQTS